MAVDAEDIEGVSELAEVLAAAFDLQFHQDSLRRMVEHDAQSIKAVGDRELMYI